MLSQKSLRIIDIKSQRNILGKDGGVGAGYAKTPRYAQDTLDTHNENSAGESNTHQNDDSDITTDPEWIGNTCFMFSVLCFVFCVLCVHVSERKKWDRVFFYLCVCDGCKCCV